MLAACRWWCLGGVPNASDVNQRRDGLNQLVCTIVCRFNELLRRRTSKFSYCRKHNCGKAVWPGRAPGV